MHRVREEGLQVHGGQEQVTKGGWIHPPQQQAPFEGLGSARVRRKRTWTPPFATPTPQT